MFAKVLFFILFIFSILNGIYSIDKAQQQELHDMCLAEAGATEDLIVNARTGQFPNNKKLKCYMKCLVKAIGVLNEDGLLKLTEEILNKFPVELRPVYKKMGDACLPKVNQMKLSDHCDVAFQLNKCLYNFDPKNYPLY